MKTDLTKFIGGIAATAILATSIHAKEPPPNPYLTRFNATVNNFIKQKGFNPINYHDDGASQAFWDCTEETGVADEILRKQLSIVYGCEASGELGTPNAVGCSV